MARRDVPEEVAERVLERFTEVGLIDDAAFARQWVESRHRSRGLAPRALKQELRRKGVGDEDAAEALEQIDEDDQRAAARALVDKKLRSMRGLDQQVATRRLAGLLARGLVAGGETIRLLLGVGLLGGFTTFSAFSLDAVLLIERGDWGAALAYILASVIGSIVALLGGLQLVRAVTA